MITVEESGHAIRRQPVLRVQPLRSMAAAANIHGNFLRGAARERLYFMFRVAVRAGRRVTFAPGQGLAVNARRPVPGLLVMTRAASFGLPRHMQRRQQRTRRDDFMGVVAVLAGGGIRVAGFQSQAMHTGGVTLRLLRMTTGAIDRLGSNIVIRMFFRKVGVATGAGVGPMNRRREFGRINKQRNRLARRIGYRERFVRMTIQAIAVFQTRRRRERQRNHQCGPKPKIFSPEDTHTT